MSSRIFQGIILQMKDASTRTIGVIDETGTVISCTDLSIIGKRRELDEGLLEDITDGIVRADGATFKPLSTFGNSFDFAAFVEGEDELALSLCQLASIALNGAKQSHDEKHDKATFIKNIILDNILPGDIYVRSRELHFDIDVPYAVILVRLEGRNDLAAVDVMQNMFPDRQRDFVFSVSETDIALVKEVTADTDSKELMSVAKQIEETVSSEL